MPILFVLGGFPWAVGSTTMLAGCLWKTCFWILYSWFLLLFLERQPCRKVGVVLILDSGSWILGCGLRGFLFWILDLGFWGFGFWSFYFGFWIFGIWSFDFGFWILDFGIWILEFWFWILDLAFWGVGFWSFGFGILDFGIWILRFGFWSFWLTKAAQAHRKEILKSREGHNGMWLDGFNLFSMAPFLWCSERAYTACA